MTRPDVTEVYLDKAGGWRWRRVAPNGEVIADSGEAYTREDNARAAARRTFGPDPDQDSA
jgi:hypothetical protein